MKFQTFAYNSRTVQSGCMNFGLQFEINELYVCAKFRGSKSRDFGFRIRKPSRKFGVKIGLIGTTDARVACSAIIELMSAKFQTFAYNSRTV